MLLWLKCWAFAEQDSYSYGGRRCEPKNTPKSRWPLFFSAEQNQWSHDHCFRAAKWAAHDDICFAPHSKTRSHTTIVFVQPNERHNVKAIPKWQRQKNSKHLYIAICSSDGIVGHVCARLRTLWVVGWKTNKDAEEIMTLLGRSSVRDYVRTNVR